ncbi:MAG: hypothetical protein ACI4I2_03650 [Oscillospiraceae bacterium]
MKIKKIVAAIAAAAVAVSAMAVTVSAETIGTAGIYLADEAWGVQYWGGATDAEGNMGIASVTPAEITGDGTYTTSIEFTDAMGHGQFFGLCTDIAGTGDGAEESTFADYPDAVLAITSVKADGNEVLGNAEAPDINDSGLMRVNIFNPWAPAELNYAYDLDWTSGIKKIEVTFTVTGMGAAADTTADTAPAETTETTSTATGNTSAAVILSVMAVAGVAAIAAKKRK